MKLHADRNSLRASEISLLACFESLAAGTFVLVVVIYFRIWTPFAISVILAPLALIRTKGSDERCTTWLLSFSGFFEKTKKIGEDAAQRSIAAIERKHAAIEASQPDSKIDTELEKDPEFQEFLHYVEELFEQAYERRRRKITLAIFVFSPFIMGGIFAFVFCYLSIIILAAIFIRTSAAAVTCVVDLPNSIAAIPRNWRQAVFCLDSTVKPVMVPGICEVVRRHPSMSHLIVGSWPTAMPKLPINEEIYGSSILSSVFSVFMWLVVTLEWIVVYGASVLVRLSVKSSAIVYLPLVYLTSAGLSRKNTLEFLLDHILNSRSEQMARLVAVSTFAVLVLKLLLLRIGSFT